MPFAHLLRAAAIVLGGQMWAQHFPDVDNRVPEVKVTEVFESGNELKVTVQNISARTLSGLSMVLGRHKVVKDWSGLAGGGLQPNATTSVTISAAGLTSGGTRHHPASTGTLELSDGVFTDHAPPLAESAAPVKAAEPVRAAVGVQSVTQAHAPAAPDVSPASVVTAAPAATESPVVQPALGPVNTVPTPAREVAPAPVAVSSPSRPPAQGTPAIAPAAVVRTIDTARAAPASAARTVDTVVKTPAAPTPVIVTLQTRPAAEKPVIQSAPVSVASAAEPAAAESATGQPGTRDEGSRAELAKLLSLVDSFAPELASEFPRSALRKMTAAVVTEQNALAGQAAVTPYDQGQRSALQSFAFGLQTIQDRRGVEDDALREQVGRFLRNQRQTLAKP